MVKGISFEDVSINKLCMFSPSILTLFTFVTMSPFFKSILCLSAGVFSIIDLTIRPFPSYSQSKRTPNDPVYSLLSSKEGILP